MYEGAGREESSNHQPGGWTGPAFVAPENAQQVIELSKKGTRLDKLQEEYRRVGIMRFGRN